jgi:O-acetylserine/cysteine efflux transporter
MQKRHVVTAILIAIIWGGNFSAMKVGVRDFPPIYYMFLRSLLVIPLILFIPRPKIPWKLLILLGTLIYVLKIPFVIAALRYGLGAGISAIVLQSQVFFTLLLAVIFLKERPKTLQIAGVIISFAGVVFISGSGSCYFSVLGFFLVLCAAISWAIYNIKMTDARGINAVHLTVWMHLVAPLPLFLFSLLTEGWETIYNATVNIRMDTVYSILYASYLAGFLGYVMWGNLLRRYQPTIVAPFSLLVPVSAMIISYFVLNERCELSVFIGAGLVIFGLILNQYQVKGNT